MKWLTHPVAFALIATALLATIPGCKSPSGDAQPNNVRPSLAHRGHGPKGPLSAIPITVVKVVPSPTPYAKGKRKTAPRPKTGVMPADTSVPFSFSIASEFWPEGVEEVTATIKCYEVASVYPVSTGFGITTTGSALPVFPNAQTSKVITITPSNPQTVNLTFSSSSCADKQLMVGVTGIGEDGSSQEYDFGGGEIFVVSE